MIPFRDENPSGSVPVVAVVLIVVNLVVFLYEVSLAAGARLFLYRCGLIPSDVIDSLNDPNAGVGAAVMPNFTSMFLHGGWLHVIGNMWYLWIFGDSVEDRLGHGWFLAFYLVCGVVAAVTQISLNANSDLPTIGPPGPSRACSAPTS